MIKCVVIDMINDFVNPFGSLYIGELPSKMSIDGVNKILNNFKNVIFINDSHEENDKEFKMFPAHAIKGTSGAEICNEILVSKNDIILSKTTFSGVYNTNLLDYLETTKKVLLCGVCTSICIMFTAADLRKRGFDVIIPTFAVADFDQKADAFALNHMKNILGCKIVDENELDEMLDF